MHSSLPQSLLALGFSSALLVLGGCGEEDGGASPTATPATPTPSVSATASPSATPSKVPASTNLDQIRVTGDFGKAPKVSVKAPWVVDKTRVKVLKATNGPQVKAGQTVEVNYYGMNARTGKKFDDSFSRGQTAALSLDQVVPGFKKGLIGQRQGSRVLVAIAGPDGYDQSGGNPQIDVKVGDTLLFVIDVVGVQLSGPVGSSVPPKEGLPTVQEKGGKLQVTVPKKAPPTSLQVQPLIKGTGKKVAPGDTIAFNYHWVAWKDGRLLEESYSSKPATAELGGLLPGLQKGLIKQTVGSRVLLVIPPADGYPAGNETPKIERNETLVMVVDLLFTQSQS